VIETPFCFLEVGKEGIGADTSQPGQTGFGVTPKRLDAIDVTASPGEFIVSLKNQAVVSAPPIGENDAFVDQRDMSLNYLEEFSFRTIGQFNKPPASRP